MQFFYLPSENFTIKESKNSHIIIILYFMNLFFLYLDFKNYYSENCNPELSSG